MKAYYGSRISPNQTETSEGYLIAHNVPIARVGKYEYVGSEFGADTHDIVPVYRTPEEVFSQSAMASFEGKPVVNDHPPLGLTSENALDYAKGTVTNVRRGKGSDSDLLLADLIIYDQLLIDAIRNGKREVSAGYECDYLPNEDGTYSQKNIIGNHVAVVDQGRAGHRVRINDEITKDADGDHWVTVTKEGKAKGRHILINGKGEIVGGPKFLMSFLAKEQKAGRFDTKKDTKEIMPGDIIKSESGLLHRVHHKDEDGNLKVRELTHNGQSQNKLLDIKKEHSHVYAPVLDNDELAHAHEIERHAIEQREFQPGDIARDQHRDYQITGHGEKGRMKAKVIREFGKPVQNAKEINLPARSVGDLQLVKPILKRTTSEHGREVNDSLYSVDDWVSGRVCANDADCDQYKNEDDTFKGGFDGAVKYFKCRGYSEEAAKKIAGKIASEKGEDSATKTYDSKEGSRMKMKIPSKTAQSVRKAFQAMGFKQFAMDAEPDEIMDAWDAMSDEEREEAERAQKEDKKDDPTETNDDAEDQERLKTLEAKVDKLMELLEKGAKTSDEKSAEETLDEELEKLDAEDENNEEESQTVEPEEMTEDDPGPIAPEDERTRNGFTGDSGAKRAALLAIKPVLASIPDEKTRRQVVDTAIASFQGRSGKNTYGKMAHDTKKRTQQRQHQRQSEVVDYTDLGMEIARKWNPHYKNHQ